MREKNRRAARGKDVKFMRGQAVKLMCSRCESDGCPDSRGGCPAILLCVELFEWAFRV